jgi:hypothetical protein
MPKTFHLSSSVVEFEKDYCLNYPLYVHGDIFLICNLIELQDWVFFLSVILLKLGEASRIQVLRALMLMRTVNSFVSSMVVIFLFVTFYH